MPNGGRRGRFKGVAFTMGDSSVGRMLSIRLGWWKGGFVLALILVVLLFLAAPRFAQGADETLNAGRVTAGGGQTALQSSGAPGAFKVSSG